MVSEQGWRSSGMEEDDRIARLRASFIDMSHESGESFSRIDGVEEDAFISPGNPDGLQRFRRDVSISWTSKPVVDLYLSSLDPFVLFQILQGAICQLKYFWLLLRLRPADADSLYVECPTH